MDPFHSDQLKSPSSVDLLVAVKHEDLMAIQMDDSPEIQMAIQQTKTSVESPIFLNRWIASRVAPLFWIVIVKVDSGGREPFRRPLRSNFLRCPPHVTSTTSPFHRFTIVSCLPFSAPFVFLSPFTFSLSEILTSSVSWSPVYFVFKRLYDYIMSLHSFDRLCRLSFIYSSPNLYSLQCLWLSRNCFGTNS